MIRTKERTIDVYKRAGAEMRLLKSVLSKVTVDVSKVLSATETDRLLKRLGFNVYVLDDAEQIGGIIDEIRTA